MDFKHEYLAVLEFIGQNIGAGLAIIGLAGGVGVGLIFASTNKKLKIFVEFFKDSNLEKNWNKKGFLDYQVLCAIICLIGVIMLLVFLFFFCKTLHFEYRSIAFSLYFFSIIVGIFYVELEKIIFYFGGSDGILMKIRLGRKYFSFFRFILMLECIIIFCFTTIFMPEEGILPLVLLIILAICVIIHIFSILLLEAMNRNIHTHQDGSLSSVLVVKHMLERLNSFWGPHYYRYIRFGIAIFAFCIFKNYYSPVFKLIFGDLFVTSNELILGPFGIIIINIVLVNLYVNMTYNNNKFLFIIMPISVQLFLEKVYYRIAVKRYLLITTFILRLIGFLFFQSTLVAVTTNIPTFCLMSVFFLPFILIGCLFNTGKVLFEMNIKEWSELTGAWMPLINCRNAQGDCVHSDFPFLEYDFQNHRWKKKILTDGQGKFYFQAPYSFLFNRNLEMINSMFANLFVLSLIWFNIFFIFC